MPIICLPVSYKPIVRRLESGAYEREYLPTGGCSEPPLCLFTEREVGSFLTSEYARLGL